MTRAVLPERVTLHLWGSGTFTTRAQCRQPRLSQPCTRSLRIDVSAPARASPQHLPASPCSLTTVSCPDCCRVRPSADAHGIVLAVLCLLCLLGGGIGSTCDFGVQSHGPELSSLGTSDTFEVWNCDCCRGSSPYKLCTAKYDPT